MNDDKKKSNFFTDKGLYIVLFICVAIVGIGSWALIFSQLSENKNEAVSVVNGNASQAIDGKVSDLETDKEKSDDNSEVPETKAPKNETADAGQAAVSVWQENRTELSGADDTEAAGVDEYIWPLSGAVEVSYSMSELIYDKTMLDWRTHDGLDIEAKLGTKVMAVMNGTVAEVYTDDMYGTTVVIMHGDDVTSIYSNLAGVPTVDKGDVVCCGDVIGSVGDTATAEMNQVSHLHFAMTADGKSIDPMDYLPNS